MSTVNEDLQTIAAALRNLAQDLGKIGREAAKLESSQPATKKREPAVKPAAPKKGTKKTEKSKTKIGGPRQSVPQALAKPGAASVLDQVFDAVRRSRNGATIAKLKEKTGLESRQLSNALYKLSKRGKIESPSRGVYVKKKG
jgi:predicted Rossmann fold nucleotide-binding protein DprA/Smf involved in DNA uptake